MKHRLEELLKVEGLTSVKFAEIMQIQPSSVSHILAGRNNPNFEFISRLLTRFPDVNPDWIINGNGNIYRCKEANQESNVTSVNDNSITDVNSKTCMIDEGLFHNNNVALGVDNPIVPAVFGEVTNVNLTNQPCVMDVEDKSQVNLSSEPQTEDSEVVNRMPASEASEQKLATPKNTSSETSRSVRQVLILYSDNTCDIYNYIHA